MRQVLKQFSGWVVVGVSKAGLGADAAFSDAAKCLCGLAYDGAVQSR